MSDSPTLPDQKRRDAPSESDTAARLKTMPSARQYKFDRGDWIAVRDLLTGEWTLVGKIVDADSESCTVEHRNGTRSSYLPGEDPISRIRWTGRGRWALT